MLLLGKTKIYAWKNVRKHTEMLVVGLQMIFFLSSFPLYSLFLQNYSTSLHETVLDINERCAHQRRKRIGLERLLLPQWLQPFQSKMSAAVEVLLRKEVRGKDERGKGRGEVGEKRYRGWWWGQGCPCFPDSGHELLADLLAQLGGWLHGEEHAAPAGVKHPISCISLWEAEVSRQELDWSWPMWPHLQAGDRLPLPACSPVPSELITS